MAVITIKFNFVRQPRKQLNKLFSVHIFIIKVEKQYYCIFHLIMPNITFVFSLTRI